ncbi:2,3-diphosphoglycerate-dependent phosphoglycerate mutase [Peptoniphilus sp. oral taxon 386]|uniref:2,3-diphosphoglycerate-dependent phosphoglycerate mutase n=1 Tax=Peptoniphilus sp. oral taxon 386 TaxID=652713 RepID=UPI0001DA9B0F|nr:2,3-diphosphoglycerate-dependent phosphoglycerate mutase [Peptoniphilus sp. oral taxon 386]EFI42089.1 2,3-bisphosphoglycerate-dependent phosphoglycerate mutase [Peptoniphilus sp. oral taxon 386 str. F0131]
MKLVLVRHGQSEWNLANLFTGWTDVDLSENGVNEAKSAGRLIKVEGIDFDIAYTSVLKRAIKTCQYILEESDQLWIPMEKSWRLNERHYGALQGLNKAETIQKYGDEQVHIWRRSYNVSPPEMEVEQAKAFLSDRRYKMLDEKLIPITENLELTLKRVMPFYEDHIAPNLRQGKNVLVAAHGNSLRALCKYLENISDEAIPKLEIATGQPIIYELSDKLEVINKKILTEDV